jgi:hypothetical protein
MGGCDREIFGLLVRRGDVAGIQSEIGRCLDLALEAVGGVDTVLGRELGRLAADFSYVQAMEGLNAPTVRLRDFLRDVQ